MVAGEGTWTEPGIVSLVSVVVTFLMGWLTVRDRMVSSAEVDKRIQAAQAASPYMHDRQAIAEKLQALTDTNRRLLEVEKSQARIEAKLGIILDSVQEWKNERGRAK